jgi:hypothetical protein
VTVTSVLEEIWDDDGENIAIAALSASVPWLGAIFNIPIIGTILNYAINSMVNSMIVAGVIDIKIGIISFMSIDAQARWASELPILQQAQAAGSVLTPEQQAAYDAALQSLVGSSTGTVNA